MYINILEVKSYDIKMDKNKMYQKLFFFLNLMFVFIIVMGSFSHKIFIGPFDFCLIPYLICFAKIRKKLDTRKFVH